MNEVYAWIHDDITWCINDECSNLKCERNQANRLTKGGFISVADFRNCDTCPLQKEKENEE